MKKRILFLGTDDSPLLFWLRKKGERVYQTSKKISKKFVAKGGFEFLISYGYRYILKKEILNLFPDKAINLHISYLPWNRGADPNFWSFVEDTPKGVTIHYLDEGIDTGDIIVQKKVRFASSSETLATSYKKLQATMQELFKKNWNRIKKGACERKKQIGDGSLHRTKDKAPLSHLLKDGWDTSISDLEGYAAETQMSAQFWEKYDSEIKEMRRRKKS